MGGTMRLGSYPASLQKGSVVAQAYGSTEITERHRHRYEVANAYRDRIGESGLVFSGTSPDGLLVEGRRAGRPRFSGVVVVDLPPEVAVERLVRYRGFDEVDAWSRIERQASREDRLAAADFVVDNSGGPEDLDQQVDALWAWA